MVFKLSGMQACATVHDTDLTQTVRLPTFLMKLCWHLQSFAKPEVQAAIMDCTQDPMNILKYQNNEEIMRVSC